MNETMVTEFMNSVEDATYFQIYAHDTFCNNYGNLNHGNLMDIQSMML